MEDSCCASKSRREHVVPLTDRAIAELKALKTYAGGSRFVLPGKDPNKPANPKLITPFRPHDLRRTGRTTLARLGVTPFIAERVINHTKDVLQETYDLWDYFDEKCDALERLEKYLLRLKASWPRASTTHHRARDRNAKT